MIKTARKSCPGQPQLKYSGSQPVPVPSAIPLLQTKAFGAIDETKSIPTFAFF